MFSYVFLWYLGCFHGGGWCLLHGVRPRTWNIRNGFQRRRLKSGTWPAKEIQTKSIVWAELSSMKYYHHPLLHYGFRRSYLKQKTIAGIIALPTYTLSWCTRGSKMMCNVDIHEQQWKDVDLSIILFICLLFGEMIETSGKATPLFFQFSRRPTFVLEALSLNEGTIWFGKGDLFQLTCFDFHVKCLKCV